MGSQEFPQQPSFLMTLARGKVQLEGTRLGGKDPCSGQEGAGGFPSQALALGVTSQISPMGQTCFTKVHSSGFGERTARGTRGAGAGLQRGAGPGAPGTDRPIPKHLGAASQSAAAPHGPRPSLQVAQLPRLGFDS